MRDHAQPWAPTAVVLDHNNRREPVPTDLLLHWRHLARAAPRPLAQPRSDSIAILVLGRLAGTQPRQTLALPLPAALPVRLVALPIASTVAPPIVPAVAVERLESGVGDQTRRHPHRHDTARQPGRLRPTSPSVSEQTRHAPATNRTSSPPTANGAAHRPDRRSLPDLSARRQGANTASHAANPP